jgi:O-antigen ligase
MTDQRFSFGAMYDPNDLAYFLVSLFPLSFFYLAHNEGIFKKIFATTIALLSVGIILLTGSRCGFIGLLAVSILFFFTKLVGLKWSLKVLLLVASVIVLMLYDKELNMGRFKALSEIQGDYNVTAEDGRLGIWKKGFRLILSNPITGVGVNCFGQAIGEMRQAENEIPRWQAEHNSFLQIAAEVGLIGFIIFGALVFGCIKNFSRIRRVEVLTPEAREVKTVAGLLQVGFIGSLLVAFFLTQGYSLIFTLYFALSAVMRKVSFNLNNTD